MTKSKLFFVFSLSFISGILVASIYYPRDMNNSNVLILFAWLIILLIIFYRNKKIFFGGILASIFILSIIFTNLKFSKLKELNFSGKKYSGYFYVINEPEIKGQIQRLTLKNKEIEKAKILLNTNIYQEYAYGDKLKIDCLLQGIENKENEFNYQMYFAKDGIFYECKNYKIEKTGENEGNKLYATMLVVKNKFNYNINRLIPAPQSGLLSGLLIGGSDNLSKSVKEDFSKTGMTHIVAVSGYNVTIIAEYLMIVGIFCGLWRRQAFWFAVSGIIIFVIFTGLSSSAVRAGIMGVLLIWAMKNGRLANSKNAIIFSADVMLLNNPLLLFYDIGFQLSFLATIGIVYLYPIFNNYLIKKNRTFGIGEILFLTISAQIFVLPIILLNFKKLSIISPLANLLVLPVVPFTMLVGFLSIMISFISDYLALFFSWLAYLLLRYETMIISYLANLKYASIEVNFSWWELIAWYCILLGLMYFIRKRENSVIN